MRPISAKHSDAAKTIHECRSKDSGNPEGSAQDSTAKLNQALIAAERACYRSRSSNRPWFDT